MKLLSIAVILCSFLSTSCDKKEISFSLERGLTETEKDFLLDEHNRLRRLQAKGKVPNHSAAADITMMEWSTKAAEHAQMWADECTARHMHGMHQEFGEGQNIDMQSGRKEPIKVAFRGWFDDEYPKYTYGHEPGKSGHYTQIVTSYSHKVGCGANKCNNAGPFRRLVCNFFIAGNLHRYSPYKIGTACSNCPAGYNYCKDFLCAPARLCKDGKCKCLVEQEKCQINGKFSKECSCTCKSGWTGINCDEVCRDPVTCRGLPDSDINNVTSDKFVYTVIKCPGRSGLCNPICENMDTDKKYRHVFREDSCTTLAKRTSCKPNRPWFLGMCQKACGLCYKYRDQLYEY